MLRVCGYAHHWLDRAVDRDYRYAAGAFTAWLAQAGGIRLLYNHMASLPLATIADGSLAMWEDRVGLAFRALVQSRAMPLIDADIRRGVVGTSLGHVRHLRREGDLVTEAIFHEVTLAPGGGAFPPESGSRTTRSATCRRTCASSVRSGWRASP